jgi:hypothetical protein
MQLPLRHEDAKVHKELIFNNLSLVIPIAIGICDLVPWWQLNHSLEQTQNLFHSINHMPDYFEKVKEVGKFVLPYFINCELASELISPLNTKLRTNEKTFSSYNCSFFLFKCNSTEVYPACQNSSNGMEQLE